MANYGQNGFGYPSFDPNNPGQPQNTTYPVQPNGQPQKVGGDANQGNTSLDSNQYNSGQDEWSGKMSLGGRPTVYDANGNVVQLGTADQLSQKFQGLAAQPAPTVSGYADQFNDQALAGQSRNAELGALGLMQNAAEGNAPSQAQILNQQATQQAENAAMSMANSVKGGAGARVAAMRNAQNVMAQTAAQGNVQNAALRAQEMANARNAYMQGASGMRSGDMGQQGVDINKIGAQQQNNQYYAGLGEQYNALSLQPLEDNQKAAEGQAGIVGGQFDQSRGIAQQESGGGLWQKAGAVGSMVSGTIGSHANKWENGVGGSGQDTSDSGGDGSGGDTSDVRAKTDVRPPGVPMGPLSTLGMKQAEAAVAQHRAQGGYYDASSDQTVQMPDGSLKSTRLAYNPDGTPYHEIQPEPSTAGLQSTLASYAGDQPAYEPMRGAMGAPVGYAADRAGQPGSIFAPPKYKSETGNYTGGAKRQTAADQRDIAMSDARAKEDAFRSGQQSALMRVQRVAAMPEEVRSLHDAEATAAMQPPAPPPGYQAQTTWADPTGRMAMLRDADAVAMAQRAQAEEQGVPPEDQPILPSARALRTENRHYTAESATPMVSPVLGKAPPSSTSAEASRDTVANRVRTRARDESTSDKRAKEVVISEQPMAEANRSMAPSEYRYRPEYTPSDQQPGEVNVGPMANNMARSPVARVAIIEQPNGMLAIDKTKGLKLVMGGLASLQHQVDGLYDAKKRKDDGDS